jgi:ferredoxin
MHATIQKPFREILEMLEGENRVFIVGCGNCARKCQSGGEPEVAAMKERLEKAGKTVSGTFVPDGTCSLTEVSGLVKDNQVAIDEAESMLVLACGQGVHTVVDATGKITHPGCNTIFGGETLKPGDVREYCQLCGECIIDAYGGLCPLTLCAKGLLNGACGGSKDGKCEVDPERDCGWNLIYERLKAIGKLDSLYQYKEPKDYRKATRSRRLTVTDGVAVFRFDGNTYSPHESQQEGVGASK